MSLLDALASLPDDASVTLTVRVSELRYALNTRNPRRLLTTGQAAAELGYSADTWRAWAEAGQVQGAFRDDGEDGTWRLPLGACEDHLDRLRKGGTNRRRARGPWKAAQAPQARGARSEADPGGKVVRLRPEALGRRQADDAGSEGAGLAGPRGTHGGSGGRG